MNIVIDRDFDEKGNEIARHVLVTDVIGGNDVAHPTLPNTRVTIPAFLALLKGNVALQAAAGYSVVSQHPGEAAPKSRWQRIVDASKSAQAEPGLTALNLV